jgi:hypothetical protein
MTHTLRIAVEVSTPDGALLPGQAARIWDRDHRLVDAYRIRMYIAPFVDGQLLTVQGPEPEPTAEDRRYLAAPGAFVTLTPCPGFAPGLHGWRHANYEGGRSCEQQPMTVGDYVKFFTGRRRTKSRTTLPQLLHPKPEGYGRVFDINTRSVISGSSSRIPFALGPVEAILPTEIRAGSWEVRALEALDRTPLCIYRPGRMSDKVMSMREYRDSFEDFEYEEIEYPGRGAFYPGPSQLDILKFLDRADEPVIREPQGFRDSGPMTVPV